MSPFNRLSEEEAAYYLQVLRIARYKTLEDAENFRAVCFALEDLGCRLEGRQRNGLGAYQDALASCVDTNSRPDFNGLFPLVRLARSDAAHRGAFARNLASKAAEVSILLEEGLSGMTTLVKHIMTKGVIFAESFYALSKVREIMLENSFSFLPIALGDHYYFISDYFVAATWNSDKLSKNDKHSTNILDFFQPHGLILAKTINEEQPKEDAYKELTVTPLLVTDSRGAAVGILTPFDLL